MRVDNNFETGENIVVHNWTKRLIIVISSVLAVLYTNFIKFFTSLDCELEAKVIEVGFICICLSTLTPKVVWQLLSWSVYQSSVLHTSFYYSQV